MCIYLKNIPAKVHPEFPIQFEITEVWAFFVNRSPQQEEQEQEQGEQDEQQYEISSSSKNLFI